MNIKPKTVQQKLVEKKWEKPVAIDWSKYELDPYATLPHGKFIGKTVEYVQTNEEWYWSWLVDNGLLGQWGLVRAKEVRKPLVYTADGSSKWIGLVVYDRATTPCPVEWYQ